MKKGIRGHDIRANGLEKISLMAKEYDIKYLQLVLEKSVEGFKLGDYTEEYAVSLKNQLKDTKVAILGSYINPSNPNDSELDIDIKKFKEKIRYAKTLKPIAVGTETGIYKEGKTDTEEAYQYLLKNLKELVIEAERVGVNVGIEGVHCFVINTPQKMKRLIDDLDSDNVKVIFDPVNYININNYQNQDDIIDDALELLADKICVIHIKDFVVNDHKIEPVKPLEGMLNYALIFRKMKKYNIDVPLICEEINECDAAVAFENMEKMVHSI